MNNIKQQITFRHQIAYYLGLNYLQYEAYRNDYFQMYCRYIAPKKGIDYKTLIENDFLKNWFDDQWLLQVEKELKSGFSDYLNAGIMNENDLVYWIHFFAQEIFKYYPHILLKEIRKEYKLQIQNNSL